MKIPNPSDKVSLYFIWREALWLPSWNRMADVSDGVTQQTLDNLSALFNVMDQVREYVGFPIHVHAALRPLAYNQLVKGAKDSAHLAVRPGESAVDFDVINMTCDEVRAKILKDGKLEEWGLRMEDKPGSDWVHLDSRSPGDVGHRFFRP